MKEVVLPFLSNCLRLLGRGARDVLVLLFGLGFFATAFAATCTSTQDGRWNQSNRWSCTAGENIPDADDIAIINHNIRVTAAVAVTTVTVNGSGILRIENANFTVSGATTVSGDLLHTNTGGVPVFIGPVTINSGGTWGNTANEAVFFRGGITNNGTWSSGTGIQTFETNNQTIAGTGAMTFSGALTVGSGITLDVARNIAVNGNLSVGANATLQPSASTVISGSGTLTGTGVVRVTRTTAGSNSLNGQYTISNKALTNLTVEYVGTAAQAMSALTYGNLTINNPSGVALAAGTSTVTGTLTLSSGALSVGAQTLVLNGPPIAGSAVNLLTTASSVLDFGGSESGLFLPSNITVLGGLTVNNVNGLAVSSVLSTGALTLTRGVIDTGGSTLTVSGNCTTSLTTGAGFVAGPVSLNFPAGAATCTFPVGTGTAYAPITVSKSVSAGAGTLTGRTVGSEHPEIVASAIDPTANVNRHWYLQNDTINASSYSVTLDFTTGDIDVGATPTNFVIGRYDGSVWSSPAVSSAQALSIASSTNGVAGPLNAASFAVGETEFVCSTPSDLPASMTCVCDNFGRATVNPSTIFGGDWTLSSSSGSFGVPKIINPGYLRLTNNSTDVATAATLPGTFPAAGNMITIDFRHYAYNGNGADGIALTLSDASVTPVPGAYGGSLGYAQKNNASCASPPCYGFAGGWIGVGIDEYGNFSNPTEGRSTNPTGSTPNASFPNEGFHQDSISVRGSGSGLVGYPYMGGTASLGTGIDMPGSASPAPGHAYRISVDARCYERNTANGEITCSNPGLAKRTQVSVYRDVTGVGDFSSATPLVNFDAYSVNGAQADVPANWKLSFTGSTGGLVNTHEIQGLKICAQFITPPAGYRIQVDNLTPSTCGTPGGSPSSPIVTITALDTNGNVVTDYDKTINLSATLAGGGASNATWRKVGAAANLPGNQYTFAPADQGVAQFYLTDASPQTVYISASENGGTLSSTFSDGVVYSGGSFNITNIDTLAAQAGGGVVAGRGHLMRISRTNGCSVDTGYDGTRNLDGWYTPAPSDHPSGASAPQLCTTNGSGTCLPTTGTCQTLSIAPPNIDAGSNFMPGLNFVDGIADFCLMTSDVGKYSISLRDDSATPVTGSSTTLTARPFAVVVSDVKQDAVLNNANGTASDSLLGIAGTSFEATIGGYLWNSAADLNNDGLPDVGATLQQVRAAGTTQRYGDTVTLSASGYAGGAAIATPLLSGGSVNVVSGSGAGAGTGTRSDLSYPEVGSFTLAAQPHQNYLNTSGVNLTPRVAIYTGASVAATRNSWVGRFRPNHFVLLDGDVTNRVAASCTPASAFTYMGEPMQVGFRLEARNAGNAITRNYAGAWAKLTNPAWLQYGVAGESLGLWMNATNFPNGGADTCRVSFGTGTQTTFSCTGGPAIAPVVRTEGARVALTNSPSPVSWADGVSTLFSGEVALHRADQPDGPYGTVNIGVAPRDSDGTMLNAFNLDADGNAVNERALVDTTAVRFGRLRLLNAMGSDRLPLSIPMRAESWNGIGFELNTLDSCTAIANANVGVIAWSGGVNNTNFTTGNLAAGTVSLLQGAGTLRFSPPTGTLTGSGAAALCVDLDTEPTPLSPACAASALAAPWLQGWWGGSAAKFDDDPRARATFGVHRGGPVIYMREMY